MRLLDCRTKSIGFLPSFPSEWRCVPETFQVPPHQIIAVECEQIIVRLDSIVFMAIPKRPTTIGWKTLGWACAFSPTRCAGAGYSSTLQSDL